MAEDIKSTKLVVIGGGPGGYAAAFLAADLGIDTTLIDPDRNPGGVCLYRGCIPSKALLHVAKLINESAEAQAWGVAFTRPKIDLDKMRSWKNDVVERLTGGLGQLTRQRKINYIRGTARFKDGTSLVVTGHDGTRNELSFTHAIIATGSLPAVISKFPSDRERILDSTSALDLADIPNNLLIVGGGYIGLELGTVYATLGSRVTVVEMTGGLLPGADRDLVAILKRRLDGKFASILLNTTVAEMKVQKNGIVVTLEGEKVEQKTRLFDKVLMSVGRRPNSQDIGLENTTVQVDKRGFIKVDAQRRTTEPMIYAIGDVAGEPMLAHKASYEGRLAVEAIAGRKVAYEPAAIPAVVFADPEIAWCGLTEAEVKEHGIPFEISKFPWGASGRAITLGRPDGLTKLIIDPGTERLLGVGIVGAGAGEMIAEAVLAMEMAATATDLGLTIHPHPTLTETMMEAADLYFGTATDYYRPKKKK